MIESPFGKRGGARSGFPAGKLCRETPPGAGTLDGGLGGLSAGMPFAVTLQATPNMTSFDVALEIARRALADKAWTNDGIFQSFRAYAKSIQPAAPRAVPASQLSTSATSQGAWTEAGVIDAFTRKYGNNEDAMRALILVMSMYTLKHDNKMWFTDYAVDHQKRIIYIATNSDSNLFYRTNENAADQLFQVLSDAMFPLTGLKESWEGMTWRLLGAGGKMAGGTLSVIGGAALMIAPEPALTKVGGAGAAVFGANTFVDGASQLFRREGGVNLIGEGFGAHGQSMAGDQGEASARYWIGWSEFLFDLAGGAATTKLGKVPLRQLPGETKQALQRGYLKLAETSKAFLNDELGAIGTRLAITAKRFGADLVDLGNSIRPLSKAQHLDDGIQLARRAKDLYALWDDAEMASTTIAVSKVSINGRLRDVVVLNGGAKSSGVEKIKNLVETEGGIFSQAPADVHAEAFLYAQYKNSGGLKAIGTSHYAGPCAGRADKCADTLFMDGFCDIYWSTTFIRRKRLQ